MLMKTSGLRLQEPEPAKITAEEDNGVLMRIASAFSGWDPL
jgi:hypothetical protein